MKIGTPNSPSATRVLLLGAGELGKEVAIELQRLGVEVHVADSYDNAPAMQVAHFSYTLSMLDEDKLRGLIDNIQPHYIIPEIEAIATDVLLEAEEGGYNVVPSAKAVHLTMNRERIRDLVSKELKIQTSPYRFANTKEEFIEAVLEIGYPCVVKPIMSSSGKGQSVLKCIDDLDVAWKYAQEGGRAGKGRVIVEGFIDFDYEITLLTIRHFDENQQTVTSFCEPIGHTQINGDYQSSWQPHSMRISALIKSREIADLVTTELGGRGVFGVELFVKDGEVWFSEVSPRPHDTGMVTMISQNLSEFALHARAILGLPIPQINQYGPSASAVILANGKSDQVSFSNIEEVLQNPNTDLRLFGKPSVDGQRRMGVVLTIGDDIDHARKKASIASRMINITI